MKLEAEIYKERISGSYRYRGYLNTGVGIIDIKSDSRFCWTSREHATDALKYLCETLKWEVEVLV